VSTSPACEDTQDGLLIIAQVVRNRQADGLPQERRLNSDTNNDIYLRILAALIAFDIPVSDLLHIDDLEKTVLAGLYMVRRRMEPDLSGR
jgi:hypothetical protein